MINFSSLLQETVGSPFPESVIDGIMSCDIDGVGKNIPQILRGEPHPDMNYFSSILISLFVTLTAGAVDYHVDAERGDDEAGGRDPGHAWRTLEKANSVELGPGDRLLFKAGSRWTGQLKPKGNGTKVAPVKIGKYGEGALPRFDGEGEVSDTILLENFAFVEISDLEVTNLGKTTAPWRTGVRVSGEGAGKLESIQLRRLFVHDVNGDLRKSHEGCGIFFEAKGRNRTHFDGLLIEGCRVERCDRNGICQRGTSRVRSRNVIIRGNQLKDIGGDGIKLWGTNGGLIEKNVVRGARARCTADEAAAGIWPFACDDTVIQFNEVSGTVGTRDGQAFDSDYQSRRTTIQYNYSFRNEGGFILICSPGNSFNEDTVIRYNISVHDGINSARVFHFGGGPRGTHIYHNTIVIGPEQQLPMLSYTEWNQGWAGASLFSNNLFIVQEGGAVSYEFGKSQGNVFHSNLFLGRHEGLPPGCEALPLPPGANAIKPEAGLESLKRFRSLQGEQAPRGKNIKDHGGRDFFGNPVPPGEPPVLGAVQSVGR